jgi:DNA polymerase III epsilon subunit-like protein
MPLRVEVNLRLDNGPHVECQLGWKSTCSCQLVPSSISRLFFAHPSESAASTLQSKLAPFIARLSSHSHFFWKLLTIMNRITSMSLANGSDLELLRRVWEDLEHKTTGFVALDTEFQPNGNIVELGFAIRQVISPGNGYARAPTTTRNIIVENARPPKISFSFGRSETVRDQQDLYPILLEIFHDLQAKNAKVVLVGHDIAGDLDRLQTACGWVKPSAVTLLDTQKIWRALHHTIERGTLTLCLQSYNINHKSTELHNAGNDAFYTLKLMFCKAEHAHNRHASPAPNPHAPPAQVAQLLPRRSRAVPGQRVAALGPLRLDRGSSPHGTRSSPSSGAVPALRPLTLEKMAREPAGYSGARAWYAGRSAESSREPTQYLSGTTEYFGGPAEYFHEYAAPSLKRKRARSEDAMERTGSERLMKRTKRMEVIDLTADTPPSSPKLESPQPTKPESPQQNIPGPFQNQDVIDLTNDASPSPESSHSHSTQLGDGLSGDGHGGVDGKEEPMSDIIRSIMH